MLLDIAGTVDDHRWDPSILALQCSSSAIADILLAYIDLGTPVPQGKIPSCFDSIDSSREVSPLVDALGASSPASMSLGLTLRHD